MTTLHLVPDPGPDDERPWEGDVDLDGGAGFQALASNSGREFKHEAAAFLESVGASILQRGRKIGAYTVDLEIAGPNGRRFWVLAHGTFDDTRRAGLRRTDTMKKLGFDAAQLHHKFPSVDILAVVSHLPAPKSNAATHLADTGAWLCDVVATTGDPDGRARLCALLNDAGPVDVSDAAWRNGGKSFQPQLFDGTMPAGPLT